MANDYVEFLYKLIKKNDVRMSVTCHQTFEEGTEPEVCNESVVEDVSDMENVLTGMFYRADV